MTPLLRRSFVALALALALCPPCPSPALADDAAPRTPEARFQAAVQAAESVVQVGPLDIALGDQGVLKLPEGYGFIPREEAQALMDARGSRGGKGFYGVVVSPDLAGFVAVEFTSAGYVKDERARDWDADELLKDLKDGTEAANAERRRQGLPEFKVVGWVEVPSYDAATHRLVWSISSRPKDIQAGGEDVNYNTYVLGREGYFSLNLVTSTDRVELEKPSVRELLTALHFNTGKRYTDFNPATDRMAEYGLAALVGGPSAQKPGLLAGVGLFLAKFWKIGLLAGVGIGAGTLLVRRRRPG